MSLSDLAMYLRSLLYKTDRDMNIEIEYAARTAEIAHDFYNDKIEQAESVCNLRRDEADAHLKANHERIIAYIKRGHEIEVNALKSRIAELEKQVVHQSDVSQAPEKMFPGNAINREQAMWALTITTKQLGEIATVQERGIRRAYDAHCENRLSAGETTLYPPEWLDTLPTLEGKILVPLEYMP